MQRSYIIIDVLCISREKMSQSVHRRYGPR